MLNQIWLLITADLNDSPVSFNLMNKLDNWNFLSGFQKVFLKAGETKTLTFTLKADDLAFYNSELKLKAEPGEFKVFVGTNSASGLEAGFELIK